MGIFTLLVAHKVELKSYEIFDRSRIRKRASVNKRADSSVVNHLISTVNDLKMQVNKVEVLSIRESAPDPGLRLLF